MTESAVGTLDLIDACLVGLFGFAAIHYAIQWWLSRSERALLVFAIQCAAYTAFTLLMLTRRHATTISEIQTAHDGMITLAVIIFAVLLQFYAELGNRNDRIFRALVLAVLAFLGVLNEWEPLRGTVVDVHPMQMPGGATSLLAIRTSPGAALAVFYLTVLAVNVYGVVVARTIWKRDRWGAVLIVLGAVTIESGGLVAVLIDFANLRAPYLGALPHAFFVLCMSLLLAREYSARAAREVVANRHFETVFEHAPIGMALLAPGGQLLRVNRALCGFLGTSADVLCTQRLQDLTREDDEGFDERLLAGDLHTTTVEKSFVRTDGQSAWALLAVSVVQTGHGRPARILAQMQDITELRAHRGRLEELVTIRTRELRDAKDDAELANAAKSRFLANMSHEIRTPLGVIMLYAQILQRDGRLDDQQQSSIDIMLSNAKHLLTVLNDVLDMSKIEAGRAELFEKPFDPGATLDEVAQMFAVQSAAKGVELTIERSAELPRSLLGDAGKVKQVLINLVSNAVKFTSRGAIRVKASATARADDTILVEIVVADSGIGIAAPDRERLFQPFEQAELGARAGGTGLGLAISLSHARLMSGDLEVESTPGVGSTFSFSFVAKRVGLEPVAEAREASPLVGTGTTHHKVLIVDDLKENRDILAMLLAQPNVETRTAADGASALAIHASWHPDVVLMDLRMPEMDGFEAIRRLRAAGSKAAIGVLSASALANDEREAISIGADFFMRKPYDDRELVERIARVLATRDRATAE